jgi:hypothetical protein
MKKSIVQVVWYGFMSVALVFGYEASDGVLNE